MIVTAQSRKDSQWCLLWWWRWFDCSGNNIVVLWKDIWIIQARATIDVDHESGQNGGRSDNGGGSSDGCDGGTFE